MRRVKALSLTQRGLDIGAEWSYYINVKTLNDPRLSLATAAIRAAYAHNVLDEADRLEFIASIGSDDLSDAEAWSRLVIHDLSARCRSFTPAVLANLIALCAACDAVRS
jgi:hypothetical protein